MAAVLLLGLVPAASALAQTAPQTETIEVTGSRIKNTDAASANPITVVTSEQINKTEAVTVEQFLRKLPDIDFTGGISQNDNNGGYGASNLGLRNLGPQRTLILVNGQRFIFTDSNASANAVDLNNIPTSMVDRIEILRDGASSAYGADAVGGVINIITKQHFSGVEVGGGVGETSYGDGVRYNVYSTVGADFDRGNIMINVSHDHQDAVSNAARAWAASEHPEADSNDYSSASGRVPGAQGTVNPGTSTAAKFYWYGTGASALSTNPILAKNAYTLGNPIAGGAFSGGQLPPGVIAVPGAVLFDYLPTEGLTSGLDRTQINLTSHYDLAPNVTAIFEAFYTDRQSNQLLNPEPIGAGTPTPQFPAAFLIPVRLPDGSLNPANPTTRPGAAGIYGAANVDTPVALSTRRFENGDRVYTDDINTSRIRVGLEGSLLGQFDWQAGYFYGRSAAQYNIANEANFAHIAQQLGINSCGTAAAQGCSIANYFGYQTLTPEQARYSVFDNRSSSTLEMQDAYGNISGPVYQLPAGPLNAAFGFEYRTDGINNIPDSVVAQGDSATFEQPTQGSYATSSVYGELNVPILSNLPFIKTLTGDVSSRYDYNTTFGRSLTYKIGLDYAIDDDFRLRGNHSTGFRAPQVKELYAGQAGTTPSGTDPCATNGNYHGSAACMLDFQLSGLNPGTSPPSIIQIPGILGGNPTLKPETSNEWTFGTVVTPHWVPGLTITTDYYTVLVRNEISTYDPVAILNSCYGGVAYIISRAQACKFANYGHRGGDGGLPLVSILNANIGDELTSGIDVNVDYGFDASKIGLPLPGRITLSGSANYLIGDTTSAQGVSVNNAGTFNGALNGGTGEPRWKALMGASYAQDSWSMDFAERYFGGVKNVNVTPDPGVGGNYDANGNLLTCSQIGNPKGCGDWEGNEAPGVFYTDVSFSYKFKNVSLTVG
ncbi:MAG TPA: TonB-dependent receptor, partial [Aliidongia sp.]|uniref:TonB-dependent receptor plug domain-containing protein n=1 Tax=Aliidongia sp. TaxID=1914230 RepID=UPI002DDD198D